MKGRIIKGNDGRKYRRVSRWIRLYPLAREGYYFRWHGRRYRFEDFIRLTYPIFYRDEDGKDSYLSGVYSEACYKGYYIEIHPDCEYIRLYEEMTEE